jgi:serine protease Do
VYAIGHPLGLDYTLTRGIVSAVDRDIDGWRTLQVDAAINPGNSGGPLYGENGDLIGIISCSRLESQGINFAVPADIVYGKFNAYLDERSRGCLHYCTVCGTASRDPRYCDHCGSLIALIEAVDEEEGALIAPQQQDGVAEESAVSSCPCCGAASQPGERYCAVCGATL